MTPRVTTSFARGALLTALVLTGCENRTRADWLEGSDQGEVWPAPDGSFLLTQSESGELIRLELSSRTVAWRFRHHGALRHGVIDLPEPRLVCAPQFVGRDAAYLVFSDWLVSLSLATGTVRWRHRLHSAPSRSLCPTAAPDGALVQVVQRGRAVSKLSRDGNSLWLYALPDGAVATTSPVLVPNSGDILVRAGSILFSLNPAGELNWTRPVKP